jgi:hypothetical protein
MFPRSTRKRIRKVFGFAFLVYCFVYFVNSVNRPSNTGNFSTFQHRYVYPLSIFSSSANEFNLISLYLSFRTEINSHQNQKFLILG